jgi:hypothetical protein
VSRLFSCPLVAVLVARFVAFSSARSFCVYICLLCAHQLVRLPFAHLCSFVCALLPVLACCSTSITHLSLAQTYYHTKEWNATLNQALTLNTTIKASCFLPALATSARTLVFYVYVRMCA